MEPMSPPKFKSNEESKSGNIQNHKFCNTINKYYEKSNRIQTNQSYDPEVESTID